MPSDPSLTIRPFTPDDAGAVADVINTTMRRSNAADYSAEVIDRLTAYHTPDKLRALVEDGRETLVAVDGDGRIVGTGSLDDGEVATLFVLPEWQGSGAGQALMRGIEALARGRGLPALRLRSSITAAGFYERLGYVRTGPTLDGPAGPQVPMSKPVG